MMRNLSIFFAFAVALAGCGGGSGGTTTGGTSGGTTGGTSANPVDGFVVFLPPETLDAATLNAEVIDVGGGKTGRRYRAEFLNPTFEGLPGAIVMTVRPRPEGMPDAVLAAANRQAFEEIDSAACGEGTVFALSEESLGALNQTAGAEVISLLFKGCTSADSEEFSALEISAVVRGGDDVVLSNIGLVRPKYDVSMTETWLTRAGGTEVSAETIHAGIETWPTWVGAITPCFADPAQGPSGLAPCLEGSSASHVSTLRGLGYDSAFIQ